MNATVAMLFGFVWIALAHDGTSPPGRAWRAATAGAFFTYSIWAW